MMPSTMLMSAAMAVEASSVRWHQSSSHMRLVLPVHELTDFPWACPDLAESLPAASGLVLRVGLFDVPVLESGGAVTEETGFDTLLVIPTKSRLKLMLAASAVMVWRPSRCRKAVSMRYRSLIFFVARVVSPRLWALSFGMLMKKLSCRRWTVCRYVLPDHRILCAHLVPVELVFAVVFEVGIARLNEGMFFPSKTS